jgi:hypothetical protein
MRKLIVLTTLMSLTGCATVPTTQQDTDKQEYQNTQGKQLVTSLLVLGAVLYVANEVADKNRNKQCANNKFLYRGTGGQRLYVCPGKLP